MACGFPFGGEGSQVVQACGFRERLGVLGPQGVGKGNGGDTGIRMGALQVPGWNEYKPPRVKRGNAHPRMGALNVEGMCSQVDWCSAGCQAQRSVTAASET